MPIREAVSATVATVAWAAVREGARAREALIQFAEPQSDCLAVPDLPAKDRRRRLAMVHEVPVDCVVVPIAEIA
ncbi:MAG: hypothetical protein ACKPKO_09215, partial [Candidatus Fonsibacter sp.]